MPEITFWSVERMNHSPLGRSTLPGGALELMALWVFGFGFPNFSLLLRAFFRGFYESLFLYFFLLYREVFWVFSLKFLFSIFPVFSFER